MRFDDRLETVLRIDPANDSGRAAMWRQLVDLLAQSGASMSVAAAARGLAAIAFLRPRVPLAARLATTRAVAARCTFAPLVTLLSADEPAVVIALFDKVRLDDDGWIAILPDLGPLARSCLRRRRDLSAPVVRALASFGTMDFALPVSDTALIAADVPVIDQVLSAPDQTGHTVAPTNIRDLVRRIEEYRSRQPASGPPRVEPAAEEPDFFGSPGLEVTLRADVEGGVRVVKGLPRSAIVGLTLATPAQPGESGVDAGVARAFSKRGSIRSGRLWLAGAHACSGYWLIDADPRFDAPTGAFLGYDARLRRALPGELPPITSEAPSADPAGGQGIATAMRQMIHELRSPLNAISGFAQLIDGQYFGPVSQRYRGLANSIIADASSLAHTFEDIDLAARLDMGTLPIQTGMCDFAATVTEIVTELRPSLEQQGRSLDIVLECAAIPVAMNAGDGNRLARRLLHALAGAVPAGDTLRVAVGLSQSGDSAHVIVQRPQSLSGLSAAMLFSQDDTADAVADAQVPMGLGFALRLVQRLAVIHGGSLTLTPEQLILNLPTLYNEGGQSGTAA